MKNSGALRGRRNRRKFQTGELRCCAIRRGACRWTARKPARALLVCLYADPEPYPGEDLERELRRRFDSVATLRADTKFAKAENLKLPGPDSYDVAILALFVRVSDRKGDVDVPADQFPLIQQIYKMGKPGDSVGLGKSLSDRAVSAGGNMAFLVWD